MNKRLRWIGSLLKGEVFSRQAKRAYDIQAQVQYCNPEYDFEASDVCEVQGNHPLIIAKLKPKEAFQPSFSFRWDSHGNHLNVDIIEVASNPEVTDHFKRERDGYHGHVPKMVSAKSFDVDIGIPSKEIFKGNISFKIHEDVATSEVVGIGEKGVVLLRKDDKVRKNR